MKLNFLVAAMPLTKTFMLVNGSISKSDYPNAKNFTSDTYEVKNPRELYDLLRDKMMDKAGPCLLTGLLERPLENESRAKMVKSDQPTQLIMFDLDKAPFTGPDEFMKAVDLADLTYIWQWSSSAKLDPKQKRISGHIFVMLDKPMPTGWIKTYLMTLNLRTEVLKKHIQLSDAAQTLKWPLDIVVNDNGRLVFIATPRFKGVQNPILDKDRLIFKKGAIDFMPNTRLGSNAIGPLKKEARELLNVLRKAAGHEPLKTATKIVNDFEVQVGSGEVTVFQMFDCGEYYRYNLGPNGDSRAYWHPKGNFEYMHSFKGEPSMLMKEILPDHYKSLKGAQNDAGQTKSEDGDLVLCFREKRTAEYWKGLYNPEKHLLDIHKVKSKDQLMDYFLSHGVSPPSFIQEYQLHFDPTSDQIINESERMINTFIMPRALRSSTSGPFPTIQTCIDSAVGTGPVQDHFINWLACIFQYRMKTQTAWILHGTQGTGKGVLFEHVIQPLLTDRYTTQILANRIRSDFSGWQENQLIVMIDEIEVDLFESKSLMESFLKDTIVATKDKIHRKGIDEYYVKSFVNLIFGSNKEKPVIIPANDRRFNVAAYQPERWFPTMEQINKLIPQERIHFAHFLMNYEADANKARTILQTIDRETIQNISETAVQQFSRHILEGKLEKLVEQMPSERAMNELQIVNPIASAYANLIKRFLKESESRITRDELQILFHHGVGKLPSMEGSHRFTTFLNNNGIHTKRLRVDGLLEYLIIVKWNISDTLRQEFVNTYLADPPKLLRKIK